MIHTGTAAWLSDIRLRDSATSSATRVFSPVLAPSRRWVSSQPMSDWRYFEAFLS